MIRVTMATVLLGGLFAAGCNKPAETPPAEVPGAGPAAVDAGPAPDGQTEPPADGAATPETPPAEPEKPSGASLLPAGGLPHPSQLQPVAFLAAVDVEITDWKGVESWIASNKGKVVVVDLWSLSCEPCRREFPNLVKLHNDHSSKVACLSVSTDYVGIKSKPPAFYKPKVLEFLSSQNATCKNILCSIESEELFESLDLASIPAVYVYGKDGKLAKRFAGEEVHYEKEVLPLVAELMKK